MLLEMYRASGTGLRRRANPQSTPSAAMVPDMPSRKTVSSTASTNQGRHQAGQEQPGREAADAKIDLGIDGLDPVLQVPPRQRVDCAGVPLSRTAPQPARRTPSPQSVAATFLLGREVDVAIARRPGQSTEAYRTGPAGKVRVGVVDLVEPATLTGDVVHVDA
jgi:hypothetical protein